MLVFKIWLHLFALSFSLLRLSAAPPAGDPPADPPASDPPDDDDGSDIATLKLTLKKERDARKVAERDLKPLKTYKEQQEAAKLTESQRLETEKAKLEADRQSLTKREQAVELRDEIARTVAAEKLTLQAPISDVMRLLDTEAVTWENGKPVNVGTLVKQLVKERPYLVAKRSGSADGGDGDGTSPKKESMNDLIRSAWRGE